VRIKLADNLIRRSGPTPGPNQANLATAEAIVTGRGRPGAGGQSDGDEFRSGRSLYPSEPTRIGHSVRAQRHRGLLLQPGDVDDVAAEIVAIWDRREPAAPDSDEEYAGPSHDCGGSSCFERPRRRSTCDKPPEPVDSPAGHCPPVAEHGNLELKFGEPGHAGCSTGHVLGEHARRAADLAA
jgi:hypothetical protein